MDLSKLKVEVYDLLAVIVPGVLVICEYWVSLRGWAKFAQTLPLLTGTAFSVLLMVAFVLGTLLQETADLTIKHFWGKRYLRMERDRVWESQTGNQLRVRIGTQLGHEVEDVDVAFDYCLTKIGGAFSKRDLFLAHADFARSLVFVCSIGIAPLSRVIFDLSSHAGIRLPLGFAAVLALSAATRIFWSRMLRFRALSESPVFHTYLAQPLAGSVAAGVR